MRWSLSLTAALVLTGFASANNCYTGHCYPQYAPIVKTIVKEVVKVVPYYQKFVAVAPLVELPTYSSVYVAPTVPAPPTVQAASVVAPASAAAPSPMTAQDTSAQILALCQGLNGKLDMVVARQNDQERRLQELERIIRGSPPNGGGQAAPVPAHAPVPSKGLAPVPTNQATPEVGNEVRTQALTLYKKSCAACHAQDKAADQGGGFTLLQADGSKAKLTAKQKARMVSFSYQNKMPPPNNVHKIPELTNQEVGLIVADNPQ